MNGIFFCLVWLKKDRFLSRLGMHFRPKIHALSAKEPVMANLSSCPPAVKSRRRGVKEQYRLRNWPAYNAGLKQRGSLTVWCSPDVADGWYYQGPNKRGAQYTFSDVAIQTVLTLGMIYHLPLRQAEGFTDSVLVLMGLALRVPDYSTLSRRQADQAGSLSPPPPRGPIHLVVDATGLKVYGEGAWKVRQHGVSQRRTWRKLHLGVDEATGQIVAQTLTTAGVDDGSQVEPLLEQVQAPIEAVGGDGAYDQRKVFDALAASEPPIQPIIPPRIKAKIQQHGNTKAEPLPRDETLRAIRKKGRQAWKKTSGYHRRSIVETHIGRYKKILGDTLSARTLPNQQTETRLGCALLNRMLQLAKPESYPITQKD